MKRWLLLLLLAWVPALFGAGDALEEGMVNPGYVQKPSWFKESFLDLREDVADGARTGKGVMFYFYQDGCPYCERLINVNFAQQQISEKARSKYDVIAINMWGDRELTDLKGIGWSGNPDLTPLPAPCLHSNTSGSDILQYHKDPCVLFYLRR